MRRRVIHSLDFMCQRLAQTGTVLVDNACVLAGQPNFAARMATEGKVSVVAPLLWLKADPLLFFLHFIASPRYPLPPHHAPASRFRSSSSSR